MAADFRGALAAIEQIKADGVIVDYALGGAMALVFWTEPVPTFDIDIFVVMPSTSTLLVSLAPIYRWSETKGFPVQDEHIVFGGIPVQFIPAHNALADEAIAGAVVFEYEGVAVRVMRPEHLIALYLEPSARTAKRLQRVVTILDESEIDRARLNSILRRYNLELPP